MVIKLMFLVFLVLCSADWEFSNAPYVKVADEIIKEATVEKVLRAINEKLESNN